MTNEQKVGRDFTILSDHELYELKLECISMLDYHPLVQKILAEVLKEIEDRMSLNYN